MRFDIQRFLKSNIFVDGVCNSKDRESLINEAIGYIRESGFERFRKEFIGFKNYEAFGDQRCDCRYGYGPRHGGVVFRIGIKDKSLTKENYDDEIYALIATRDFPRNDYGEDYLSRKRSLSLGELVREFVSLHEKIGVCLERLNFEVDFNSDDVIPDSEKGLS